MAEFTVNARHLDPYKNFKFIVSWDGKRVAGVSNVSALRRTSELVEHRDGGDLSMTHKSPGQTTYEAITLQRGVTHDLEFEAWASRVWNLQGGPGAESLLADFRKDIQIDLHNEAGQKVISYFVYRCWVSEYEALPELDASGSAVAIQQIKLENEGWERDVAVVEPAFPG
jgi:phage tail-like protein